MHFIAMKAQILYSGKISKIKDEKLVSSKQCWYNFFIFFFE